MHRRHAEAVLPDEIVNDRERHALLMVDAGDHAQVWLCEYEVTDGVRLTAVRRLDAVPRGERHDGGPVPNSEVFRAGAALGVYRLHVRGDDIRLVGSCAAIHAHATILNRKFLDAEVAALQGAWRSCWRLGIPARKIKRTLDG
jgi:hypothetical protein